MNAFANVVAGVVALAETICAMAQRLNDKETPKLALGALAEILADLEKIQPAPAPATVKAAPVAAQAAPAPATVKAAPVAAQAAPAPVKAAVKLGPDTPAPAAGIDESVDLDNGQRVRGGRKLKGFVPGPARAVPQAKPLTPGVVPSEKQTLEEMLNPALRDAAQGRIAGQIAQLASIKAAAPAPAPVAAAQTCVPAAPAPVKGKGKVTEETGPDAAARFNADRAARKADKAAKAAAKQQREELAARNAAANNAAARKVDMSDLPTFAQAESERVLLCCVLVELGVRAQLAAKYSGRDAWMKIAALREERMLAQLAKTAPIGELPRS